MNKTSATPAPLNLFTKPIFYLKMAWKLKCKLWSPMASTYVHEEDQDTMSESRSLDNFGSSAHRLWKRKSTVEPAGDMGLGGFHPAQNIEDVVDWKLVVHRYLVMQGVTDLDDEVTKGTSLLNMEVVDDQSNNDKNRNNVT
ncbi:uncharacterized protein LOC106012658 [Aplysia californica]|uniref:Uncharacterized protein LOC106012658 n=1 Tax=Aplysia californica TaxID=6500 RepID=A0ABM1A6F2_APLCA|nr:uncharacterized protein LOC106012658 [Aplysia californica]